jgi:hypothetical protein
MRKILVVFMASLLFLSSSVAFAQSNTEGNIIGDALFIRPIGLVSIVAGTAIFVVSLPFAVITKDVPKTAKQLVVDPFNYTFDRPIGDFRYQTDTMGDENLVGQ